MVLAKSCALMDESTRNIAPSNACRTRLFVGFQPTFTKEQTIVATFDALIEAEFWVTAPSSAV
jgi:hypothetical protein